MMRRAAIAFTTCTTLVSVASADVLLEVDLTVLDTITITATGGLSAASAKGSDFTGFYLSGLFGTSTGAFTSTLVSGDISNAENPADTTPLLFRFEDTDPGLNVWSFSSDTIVTFTDGSLAFTGAATWSLSAEGYADLLAGSTSGDIYFAADDISDLPEASLLGTYRVVPAPSSLILLGLSGLFAGRRRR
jgi:PEP-CTERM motif